MNKLIKLVYSILLFLLILCGGCRLVRRVVGREQDSEVAAPKPSYTPTTTATPPLAAPLPPAAPTTPNTTSAAATGKKVKFKYVTVIAQNAPGSVANVGKVKDSPAATGSAVQAVKPAKNTSIQAATAENATVTTITPHTNTTSHWYWWLLLIPVTVAGYILYKTKK